LIFLFGGYLCPVHGDNAIRTNNCAVHATGAIIIDFNCIMIPFAIHFLGHSDHGKRARSNTNFTTLASFYIDYDVTLDFCHKFLRFKYFIGNDTTKLQKISRIKGEPVPVF